MRIKIIRRYTSYKEGKARTMGLRHIKILKIKLHINLSIPLVILTYFTTVYNYNRYMYILNFIKQYIQ